MADGLLRNYLTIAEVEALMGAARATRASVRNQAIVWMLFRHGFRVSELCSLTWSQIHLDEGRIFVSRLKNGLDSIHALDARELRLLRKLKKSQPFSEWVFLSNQMNPISRRSVDLMLSGLGTHAGLPFRVHAHMLRHSCGHYNISRGKNARELQLYLGHRSYRMTTLYAQLAKDHFKDW